MRVDLGKDRWAELVDPDEMTHGARMRVQELLSLFTDETVHSFVADLRMRAKLIAEVVTGWSLDLPVPKGDPALLEDVPGSAYDALVEATKEHADRLDFIRASKISSRSKTS